MVKAAREFVGLFRNHNWAQSLVEASLSKTAPGDFAEVATVDDAGRWRIGLTDERRLRVAPNNPKYTFGPGDNFEFLGQQAFCFNTQAWAEDMTATVAYSGDRSQTNEDHQKILAGIAHDFQAARFNTSPTQIAFYREAILSYQGSGGYQNYCEAPSNENGRIVSARWPSDLARSRSGTLQTADQGVALIPVDRIRAWHALPADTPIPRIVEALAENEIFRTVGPEQDAEPFAVERRTTIWNHNGSKMELRLERTETGQTEVTISYSQPREALQKLGFEHGRILFQGQVVSGSLRGKAHIFRRGCEPIPYDVAGPFDQTIGAFELRGAAPSQNGDRCHPTGRTFDSSAASLSFDQDGIADYEHVVQTQENVVACPARASD